MEMVQDWAAYFLGDDHAAAFATYSPYISRFYYVLNTLKSWLLPLIDQATRKPDLATVALLLIIVLVSLKIVDMLWQTVLFWIRLAWRVLFWGGLIALAVWMWSRGPEGMWQDLQHWRNAWSSEYTYWKEKENVARLARQGVNYGRQQQGRWF